MCRALATAYGWGPEQIARLTIQQAAMYLKRDDDKGGTVSQQDGRRLRTMSLQEYHAWKMGGKKGL